MRPGGCWVRRPGAAALLLAAAVHAAAADPPPAPAPPAAAVPGVPPSPALSAEERRLLRLAIGDLAQADLAPAVQGVPQPYPNDVVRYICRYRSEAAPELLAALAQQPPAQEAGYACYCLSLVPIPPQDLPRYRVELGRVHDRLADACRTAPHDGLLQFALHCAGLALDAVAPPGAGR